MLPTFGKFILCEILIRYLSLIWICNEIRGCLFAELNVFIEIQKIEFICDTMQNKMKYHDPFDWSNFTNISYIPMTT